MKKGIFFSTASKCLALCTQIWILLALTKHYDKDSIGIWFLFSSFPFFISLADAGLGGLYLQHQLTKYTCLDKKEKKKECFFQSFYLVLILALICSLLLLTIPLPSWIFSKHLLYYKDLPHFFILFCFIHLVRLPFSLYATGFFALDLLSYKSILEIAEQILFLIAFMLAKHFSIFYFLLSYALCSLSISVIGFFLFLKKEKWSFPPFFLKKPCSMPWACWTQNVFSVLLFAPLPFFVSNSLSLETGAVFGLCAKCANLCHTLHLTLLTPLTTYYTKTKFFHKTGAFQTTFTFSFIFTIFFYSLFSFSLFVFSPLLEKRGCFICSEHFFLYTLWMHLYGWINVFSIALNGYGKIKRQTLFLIVGTCICFSFHYFSKSLKLDDILTVSILAQLPLLFSNIYEVHNLHDAAIKEEKNPYY